MPERHKYKQGDWFCVEMFFAFEIRLWMILNYYIVCFCCIKSIW